MKTKLHTAILAVSCFIVGFITSLCVTHQPQSAAGNAFLPFTGQLVRLPAGAMQNIRYRPAPTEPLDSDDRGIEAAERHNLFQMQRYQESVRLRIERITDSP